MLPPRMPPAMRLTCALPRTVRTYASGRPQVLMMDEIQLASASYERLARRAEVLVRWQGF